MRITLDNLRHFQAVVRFQNLNLAASKISISPSAISRSIKIIEEDLGYLLLTRKGRNIVLNSDGARFYEKTLSLIENYESLFLNISLTDFQGTYKIGASHWLAAKLLPSKLENLASKNLAAKFEIYSLDSHLAILKVLAGDLDMALCFSPKVHPEITSHQIYAGELILCSNKTHPLASKKSSSVMKEINNHNAIIHKANDLILSCDDHPMFLEHNIKPKFKYFWDSDLVAIELLKSHHYWSMLPDIIVNSDKTLIPLAIPRNWKAPYTINMIFHKNKANQFKETMIKAFDPT